MKLVESQNVQQAHNVHSTAEKVLQKVVHTTVATFTVLTIAHCLDTFLHSDKILGRIIEFALPKELVATRKRVA